MRMRFSAALILLAAAGCAADDGPPLAPVTGTVRLDGKPLAGKAVMFVPEPGTVGSGSGANTGPDGSYRLLALRPGTTGVYPGAVAGSYRVVVCEPVVPVDLPDAPPPPSPGEEPGAIGPPPPSRRGPIPFRYTTPEGTDLRANVPAAGGAFDFELKSRP